MIQSCCASSRQYNLSNSHHQNQKLFILSSQKCFTIVDLSSANLVYLPKQLSKKSHEIEHLILDENQLDEKAFSSFLFPNLKSLSLNSNNISNIGVFFQILSRAAPNIIFLSIIDNPGWPHLINNSNNVKMYKKYLKKTAAFFPKLIFLDSILLKQSQDTGSTTSTETTPSNSPFASHKTSVSEI